MFNLDLSSYPKERPVLSKRWESILLSEYKDHRNGKNFIQRLAQQTEGWMHGKVAAYRHSLSKHHQEILELGAGTLNHLPYERGVKAYDIIEPWADLYADSLEKSNVRYFYKDILEIPSDQVYDRIVSVAVLEHLENLPLTIAAAALHLKDEDSAFLAGIPNEGGLVWGLSWRLTTGLSFRVRRGMDYGELMRHEHLNSGPEIVRWVRHLFDKVQINSFPLPGHHLGLFSFLSARAPKRKQCQEILGKFR